MSTRLRSDNGSFFKGWDFVIKILIYTKYVLILLVKTLKIVQCRK